MQEQDRPLNNLQDRCGEISKELQEGIALAREVAGPMPADVVQEKPSEPDGSLEQVEQILVIVLHEAKGLVSYMRAIHSRV